MTPAATNPSHDSTIRVARETLDAYRHAFHEGTPSGLDVAELCGRLAYSCGALLELATREPAGGHAVIERTVPGDDDMTATVRLVDRGGELAVVLAADSDEGVRAERYSIRQASVLVSCLDCFGRDAKVEWHHALLEALNAAGEVDL